MTNKEFIQERADNRADAIAGSFKNEVARLLASGAVDPDSINTGLLFSVALANISDSYKWGDTREFNKLRRI